MNILAIRGANRRIGKSQGYKGLPVLDTELQDGTPCMQTAWEPTPEELLALMGGAPIYLHIIGEDINGDGRSHPPVMITVGEASCS